MYHSPIIFRDEAVLGLLIFILFSAATGQRSDHFVYWWDAREGDFGVLCVFLSPPFSHSLILSLKSSLVKRNLPILLSNPVKCNFFLFQTKKHKGEPQDQLLDTNTFFKASTSHTWIFFFILVNRQRGQFAYISVQYL